MPPTARAYKIGYARVSTPGQKLDAQLDALVQAGCLKTFTDHVSGTTALRPGWEQLMAYVRPGRYHHHHRAESHVPITRALTGGRADSSKRRGLSLSR